MDRALEKKNECDCSNGAVITDNRQQTAFLSTASADLSQMSENPNLY